MGQDLDERFPASGSKTNLKTEVKGKKLHDDAYLPIVFDGRFKSVCLTIVPKWDLTYVSVSGYVSILLTPFALRVNGLHNNETRWEPLERH